MMSRIQFIVAIVLLVSVQVGCQNRYNRPCGNWYGAAPVYAPQAGYMAQAQPQGQPYYDRTAALNTSAQAPTAAGGTATRAPNFRPYNGTAAPAPTQPAQPGQVAPATTTVASSRPSVTGQSVLTGGARPPANRTASAAAMPGTGSSFVDSTNFATTLNDERRDPSRLPVTNAVAVQPPSQSFAGGFPARSFQPGINNVPQTYSQNGLYVPPQLVVNGASVLVPRVPVQRQTFTGQPIMVAQPQQVVVGQPLMVQQPIATASGVSGWKQTVR